MFTARNRQNPFAKRRRELREARAEESTPEPAAVPYDTRDDASTDIVDAPDVSTFATSGVVEFPPTEEQTSTANEVLHVEPEPLPEVPPVPVEVAPEISAETRAKVDAVLNHAIEPVAPQTDAEPVDEPKRGRGRPRPQETIDRDNAVYKLLQAADVDEGISKEALALALDEKEQQVYSSLRQLTKEGRAETRYVKPHGYRWFAISPAETA